MTYIIDKAQYCHKSAKKIQKHYIYLGILNYKTDVFYSVRAVYATPSVFVTLWTPYKI